MAADQNDYGSWERGAYVYTGPSTDTCQSLGHRCCDSCLSAHYSQYDGDCPGQLCCDDCFIPSGDYQVIKAMAPPTIDGSIGEFSLAEPITITQETTGTTATYRLMWDEQALYVAASFSDQELNADPSHQDDGPLWSDDCLEIMFDPDNNGGSSIRSDDYKFFVSVLGVRTDSRAYDTSWDSGFASRASAQGTVNSNEDTDTGYVIEAMIPWPSWGIAVPQAGSVWGMGSAWCTGSAPPHLLILLRVCLNHRKALTEYSRLTFIPASLSVWREIN